MRKLLTLIVLVLVMTTMACSHLLIYDNDSGAKTAGKYAARIPLAICTLTISEYILAEESKKHNRRLRTQYREQYLRSTSEYERQQLEWKMQDIEERNAEIDRAVDDMNRSWERARQERAIKEQKKTNCHCITTDEGMAHCYCE